MTPSMPKNLFRALLASAAVLGASVVTASDAPSLSNKWRIEISEGANNAGTVQFRVTSSQGQPIDVTASIKEGRGENGVARDIRDAFRAQLPVDRFDVEADDGEDVLVKKHAGEPDFSVELIQSTLTGTRIELDRE